jgi:hypothetical protein
MSMNKCACYTVISCYSFTDSSSVTCSLSYSSFADNIATQYRCIYFENLSANYEMKCCNVLRNTQASSSDGILYIRGNTTIKDSCILENNADYIFYIYSSYYTTLSNCTADKTTSSGSFIIQNTVTNSFILALNHMSTQNCNTEYDSAGALTLIPYISDPTKKEFCYTCKINHCQASMSVFLSIVWLLMFTLIHPNPSVYC